MSAQPWQFIGTQGELVRELPDGFDAQQLVDFYRHMARARSFDRQCVAAQRQGRIGAYPTLEGQEAAQVGAAFALGPEDFVYPSYREHAIHLSRGMPMTALLALMRGLPNTLWDVRKYRTMTMSIPIASHLPHAVGHALAARHRGEDVVTLACFGEGASSAGDFHGALNFAAVWNAATVFLCQNNGYAISHPFGAQTRTATVAEKAAAYGMPGVIVDGMDVLAVYEATREAVERARSGGGPTLVEAVCYRYGGHTTSDDPHAYRDAAEEVRWREQDPVPRCRRLLESRGLWSQAQERAHQAELEAEFEAALATLDASPAPVAGDVAGHVYSRIPAALAQQFNEVERLAGAPPTRFAAAQLLSPGPEPSPSGPTKSLTMAAAINAALDEALANDASVILMGEDIGRSGGVFRITEGLQARHGSQRVVDTPLNESAIVGAAVGMAWQGMRPVVEIQFDAFIYPAFDQIVNHVGRMRSRTNGRLTLPMVIRCASAGGIHAPELHTDSPEGFFVHAPGHIVVMPATPFDAKGLLAAAIEAEDPVLFLEPKYLYRREREEVPTGRYTIPLGKARIRRTGTDLTLVTYGNMVAASLRAAESVAGDGASVEVIDLRTLYPWDEECVVASVERTGRLLFVQEGWRTAGLGAEVCAQIAQRCGYSLAAPVKRIAAPDVPWPASAQQHLVFLTDTHIAAAIAEIFTS
jgi:pyruvate dehydrogenase E1 component alpha subunit